MRVRFIIIILLCSTLACVGSVFGDEGKKKNADNKQYRIVFSIFDKSSAGKYAYLRDSVQAMLASRLATRDRITVLEKTFTEKELLSLKNQGAQKSLTIGGANADYLVTGALFSLTSGLEIKVDLYPLDADKEILHFSTHAETADSLIADINQLSQDIAETVLGERSLVLEEQRKSGDQGGVSGFVTANPEEAYKRNHYFGTVVDVAGSGVTTKGKGAQINTTLPFDMTAMAVGDVNGDGKQNILVLSSRSLKMFSIKDRAIVQTADIALSAFIVHHAINLADLDGDGKDEIYLSGTDGIYISSMILKYDNTHGFETLASNIPWYIKPLLIPGKGWQLCGQERGIERLNLVKPGVYLLSLDAEKKINKGARLALPDSVNLFDFVYADLDGDGFYEIVVVDPQEKLRVYSPGNELMWVSENTFGNSKIYIGPSRSGETSRHNSRNFTIDEDNERDLIFVPGRIIVTDINKDNKEEIVVSEGKKAGFGYLNKLRIYDSGAVVSLAWNGSALSESWRTGNFSGYVVGYGFTLVNEAPEPKKIENAAANKIESIGRLFVGNLPKSGSLADLLPGGAETDLTVYDLEFLHKKVK